VPGLEAGMHTVLVLTGSTAASETARYPHRPARIVGDAVLGDAVAHAMDAAGFELAHLAGNSLGGFVALQLAARGRAKTVVAFAPAGGWAQGDESDKPLLAYQAEMLRPAAAVRETAG